MGSNSSLAFPGNSLMSIFMECFTFENEAAWLGALEENWQQVGGKALSSRHEFKVALSGGSTPDVFYRRLAKADWPWSATYFFIGDERWVPMDHENSNYRMIYKAFYPHKINLERWKTELTKPEDAAHDYERILQQKLDSPPRFDLILLGIGDDGHTASLFPHTAALAEDKKLAVANRVPQLETFRVTMTYPLIKQAREVWFVARGEKKASWIQKMVAGDKTFPAGAVECVNGPAKIFYCKV